MFLALASRNSAIVSSSLLLSSDLPLSGSSTLGLLSIFSMRIPSENIENKVVFVLHKIQRAALRWACSQFAACALRIPAENI
jgi:hypothetical protein